MARYGCVRASSGQGDGIRNMLGISGTIPYFCSIPFLPARNIVMVTQLQPSCHHEVTSMKTKTNMLRWRPEKMEGVWNREYVWALVSALFCWHPDLSPLSLQLLGLITFLIHLLSVPLVPTEKQLLVTLLSPCLSSLNCAHHHILAHTCFSESLHHIPYWVGSGP